MPRHPFYALYTLTCFCFVLFFFISKEHEKSLLNLKTLLTYLVFPNIIQEILLRKEVIQPHVPVRLPCYDFTLLTGHTLGESFLAVRLPTLSAPNSDGVTGGVYKARERIHRDLADSRLLAIPTSCSRVAGYNPNWDRLFRFRSSFRLCFLLYRPL